MVGENLIPGSFCGGLVPIRLDLGGGRTEVVSWEIPTHDCTVARLDKDAAALAAQLLDAQRRLQQHHETVLENQRRLRGRAVEDQQRRHADAQERLMMSLLDAGRSGLVAGSSDGGAAARQHRVWATHERLADGRG